MTFTLPAQPTQSLSGQVMGYLANQVGDYDGLRLRTTGGVALFRFPPHTALQVLKLAPVGQTVVATGIRHTSPLARVSNGQEAATDYRLVVLVNQSGKTSLQIADIAPPPPVQGKLVEAEGPLTGELRDETGRLSALVTDRYVIDLKPHQRESIQALLEGVRRLGVVGYERMAMGFVNKTGRKLIHPTALTINGQTFAF